MVILSSTWMLSRFLGDFLGTLRACWSSLQTDGPCNTVPLFLGERIRCQAPILGESHNSGHNPGLAEMAKRREIPRTWPGRNRRRFSDSRSGAENGRFYSFVRATGLLFPRPRF